MKKDEENVKLSFNDLDYLLTFCKHNKDDLNDGFGKGFYWGCRKHFDKREDRIIALLEEKMQNIRDRYKDTAEG